jgi:1-acyl-sn-glycerol-3-phosphate acyltransferase
MIQTALASMCWLVTGTTVEWRCDPYSSAQRIYFGNHSSHLDFVVIWSALPASRRRHARPVAGRDYWERGSVRRYLASDVFRAVLVERHGTGGVNSVDRARAAVEQMACEMGYHDSLIVFPEGTRSSSGRVGPFRSGLYHLARARPDAELVPVHLENLNRILPKGESLPVPMVCRVTFGPVLPARAGEQKDAFLERARTAIKHLEARP